MPRKRTNGEGNLRKRPDGRWECAIMIETQNDGRRLRMDFYDKTQKEVKEKVHQYQDALRLGLTANGKNTFGEWAERWYLNYKGQVCDCTYEGYRYMLNILEAQFGKKKLSSIRTAQVEQFLKQMQEDGKSSSYLRKFRALMFQIMKKAVANDILLKDPVEYADKLKNRKRTPIRRRRSTG